MVCGELSVNFICLEAIRKPTHFVQQSPNMYIIIILRQMQYLHLTSLYDIHIWLKRKRSNKKIERITKAQ